MEIKIPATVIIAKKITCPSAGLTPFCAMKNIMDIIAVPKRDAFIKSIDTKAYPHSFPFRINRPPISVAGKTTPISRA
jgi:hypothetical protein